MNHKHGYSRWVVTFRVDGIFGTVVYGHERDARREYARLAYIGHAIRLENVLIEAQTELPDITGWIHYAHLGTGLTPKPKAPRVEPQCGHPERKHQAKGMCRNCYYKAQRLIRIVAGGKR